MKTTRTPSGAGRTTPNAFSSMPPVRLHGLSSLHRALNEGRFKSLEYLLAMKANPNVRDEYSLTPLMRCCVMMERPAVATRLARALLNAGADPTMRDATGANALHLAVKERRLGLVELLLENNDVDLGARDHAGLTVLHYLAFGNATMAELVVDAARRFHVSVDVLNREGLTPLQLACCVGNLAVAQVLAVRGRASLTMRDPRTHRTARDWMEFRLGRSQLVSDNPLQQGTTAVQSLPPLDVRWPQRARLDIILYTSM